jgi:NIMA-interacting peptidyl-prolyl cis-trans isomerase 1
LFSYPREAFRFSKVSWRDPQGKEILARSEAQARLILQGYIDEIKSKRRTFEEIARVSSDCGSAQSGGDLGLFGRGAMQKPFEDASFALAVGELSGIVSTDSGVHVILRTE